MDDDLIVTEGNLPLIIDELKLHGGHKGWKIAHELSTGQRLILEKPAESVVRFFPMVEDKLTSNRLHDADAAIDKVLTTMGRDKVCDFIDLLHLDQTYISLGVAVWAAAGNHAAYTPELIVDGLWRHSRINPATIGDVVFVFPASPVTLKKEWLECLRGAEALMLSFPPKSFGCLYLDQNGQPAKGKTFDPSWVPHYGSVKGAWPKVGEQRRRLPEPHN